MRISRDGREYELTERELSDAFYESQHRWDMAHCLSLSETFAKDKKMAEVLKADPDILARVAHRYRKYLEDSVKERTERACLRAAFHYIMKWKKEESGREVGE